MDEIQVSKGLSIKMVQGPLAQLEVREGFLEEVTSDLGLKG